MMTYLIKKGKQWIRQNFAFFCCRPQVLKQADQCLKTLQPQIKQSKVCYINTGTQQYSRKMSLLRHWKFGLQQILITWEVSIFSSAVTLKSKPYLVCSPWILSGDFIAQCTLSLSHLDKTGRFYLRVVSLVWIFPLKRSRLVWKALWLL